MARTISKSISAATIYALDASQPFDTDDNGMPIANMVFTMDGNPTQNRARLEACKQAGHKNVMILQIVIDETKLKVSPDVFVSNSKICKPDTVYGREYVTQTFKVTFYRGFAMTENGMESFEDAFVGETTPAKLLKLARDRYQSQSVVVTESNVSEQRRYMTRDKYLELAR